MSDDRFNDLAPLPPATSLDPREIYLAYTSLAIIVGAFVAIVWSLPVSK